MELDLKALRTFHRMAREGAGVAAARLGDMTGVDTDVAVTKIKFVTPEDIEREFTGDSEKVSVRADLKGGPGGQAFLVFDRDTASEVTETVIEYASPDADLSSFEDPDTEENGPNMCAMTEVSHMMNCGFIDGWADVLGTAIDVSPPTSRTGTSSTDLFGELSALGNSDLALMFQSRIELVDSEFSFYHYLFPNLEDLGHALSTTRDTIHGFRYEKLIGFDQMVEQGADEAANHLSMLTGSDTDVDIRNLNFVPVRTIPKELDEENVVGVAFTYDGLPSGYLLFIFSEESASEIISLMSGVEPDPDADEFSEDGRDALQELGNIMASGVLDGWANALNTQVTHTPPEYVRDVGPNIMDPIAAQVGQNQNYAFVFDSTISAEGHEFDCSIYSVCEEGDLETALSQLEMDDIGDARNVPEFPIGDADEDNE